MSERAARLENVDFEKNQDFITGNSLESMVTKLCTVGKNDKESLKKYGELKHAAVDENNVESNSTKSDEMINESLVKLNLKPQKSRDLQCLATRIDVVYKSVFRAMKKYYGTQIKELFDFASHRRMSKYTKGANIYKSCQEFAQLHFAKYSAKFIQQITD